MRTLTDVKAMVMEVVSAVIHQDSLCGPRRGPAVALPSEEIGINKMFHRNSIFFMGQRLSPPVSINILVILPQTCSFHKPTGVARTDLDSRATKRKILDSELCALLALG